MQAKSIESTATANKGSDWRRTASNVCEPPIAVVRADGYLTVVQQSSSQNNTAPQAGNGARGTHAAGIVAMVLAVAIVGAVAWNSLNLQSHSCSICMSYNGRSQCRKVAAASVAEARSAATVNACAFISSGMRDSMECQRTPPQSSDCR